jgi:2,3-bisphosphoglycerate-dependent phosphoglycerate mutase
VTPAPAPTEVPTPARFRQPRFTPPPGATEILLVRHGESEAAVAGRSFELLDGQGDPALSPEGRVQAEKVGARLGQERIDAIYVTTLRRTAETAAPLVEIKGLAPVVEPDLREVFVGDWEGGLLRQKVAERDPVAVRMFEEQRWDVIPGAEPAASFRRRVGGAVERIAAAHGDGRVVVFSHGGTIGEVLAQATRSEPFAFAGADNGSISGIVVTPGRWILRRYNDTAHLDPGVTSGPGAPPAT